MDNEDKQFVLVFGDYTERVYLKYRRVDVNDIPKWLWISLYLDLKGERNGM